mmetsp:Transcript_8731/g.36587  ORF Transcript_8731/g.36587 Transcript_8731/m.36587 type:complete len:272 (+) Transcript_8731:1520-2335(+)
MTKQVRHRLFCGAVLVSPYFLNFLRKLRLRENAPSTATPLFSQLRTARTSSSSFSPTKFVTNPFAPNRAVLPILCRYSTAFPANSACTTCATPGTSTPLAAASVQASTETDPSANARSRSARSELVHCAPNASALKPCLLSSAATASHASALFTKTIVLAQSTSGRNPSVPSPSAAPSASALLVSETFIQVCVTFGTARCKRRPSTQTASGNPYLIIAPGVFFPLLITVAAANAYCRRNARPAPTPTPPLPPSAGPLPFPEICAFFFTSFS